ncbi:MAG TPA: DUF2314 domain-containing protein [Pyrinomonadaceae bacterium]|nr:DUF2314 domain-containing protein [Pyrinomonadaceae bacterium]
MSLFVETTSATSIEGELRRLCKGKYSQLGPIRELEELSSAKEGVYTGELTLAQNPVPDSESLKYFGRELNGAWLEKLMRSKCSLVIVFHYSPANKFSLLRSACGLVGELALSSEAVIADDNTSEYFSPSAWTAKRLAGWTGESAPNVVSHITTHQYSNGELERAVTLGMDKFGLPDIVVEGFPRHWANSVGALIELIAQLGVERGHIPLSGTMPLRINDILDSSIRASFIKSLKPGASETATVTLRQAVPDEGDPLNALVSVVFDEKQGETLESQARFLRSLFGSTVDSVQPVASDDAELIAAKARVRAKLPELARRFRQGLPLGGRLLLKARFMTDTDDIENMWFEVRKWEAGRITGTLLNEPYYISALNLGSTVTIDEDAVIDYIYSQLGQPDEGNEKAPFSTGDRRRFKALFTSILGRLPILRSRRK